MWFMPNGIWEGAHRGNPLQVLSLRGNCWVTTIARLEAVARFEVSLKYSEVSGSSLLEIFMKISMFWKKIICLPVRCSGRRILVCPMVGEER